MPICDLKKRLKKATLSNPNDDEISLICVVVSFNWALASVSMASVMMSPAVLSLAERMVEHKCGSVIRIASAYCDT